MNGLDKVTELRNFLHPRKFHNLQFDFLRIFNEIIRLKFYFSRNILMLHENILISNNNW